MRVLFVSAPAVGHVLPMVPLAYALRAEGHEVLLASFDGAEIATSAGLHLVNIAPGVQVYHELFVNAGAKRPELLERVKQTIGADREAFVGLFAHVNDRVADGLVDLAGQWRPDLVVYEYISPIGLLAAQVLGVPAVQLELGLTYSPPHTEVMLAELAETFQRHGVEPGPGPALILDITPPSLLEGPAFGLPMRPLPTGSGATLPEWLRQRPDRPRIAVTVGTVHPVLGDLDSVKRVSAVAEEVDAEFVLALGKADLDELDALPPNVRACNWVPWPELLQTSAVGVHHAGCGSSLATMYAGLPHLAIPAEGDCTVISNNLVRRGLALSTDMAGLSAELLNRLLAEESFQRNAAEVQAEIMAMPTPASHVPRLVELAGRR